MTTRTATIKLSAEWYPPQHTWVINWDKVFKGAKGKCFIRADLLSVMKVEIGRKETGRLKTSSFECITDNGYTMPSIDFGDLVINNINNTSFFYSLCSKQFIYPITIPSGETELKLEIVKFDKFDEPLEGFPDYSVLLTFEWVE